MITVSMLVALRRAQRSGCTLRRDQQSSSKYEHPDGAHAGRHRLRHPCCGRWLPQRLRRSEAELWGWIERAAGPGRERVTNRERTAGRRRPGRFVGVGNMWRACPQPRGGRVSRWWSGTAMPSRRTGLSAEHGAAPDLAGVVFARRGVGRNDLPDGAAVRDAILGWAGASAHVRSSRGAVVLDMSSSSDPVATVRCPTTCAVRPSASMTRRIGGSPAPRQERCPLIVAAGMRTLHALAGVLRPWVIDLPDRAARIVSAMSANNFLGAAAS